MSSPHKISILGLLVAWLVGSLVTYFVLAFQSNFLTNTGQLVLWGAFLQTLFVLSVYFIGIEVRQRFAWRRHGLQLLVLLVVFGFSMAVIWLVVRFPDWFDARLFLLREAYFLRYLAMALASLLWNAAILAFLRSKGWDTEILSSGFFQAVLRNLPGILLALFFLTAYFGLAVTFSPLLHNPAENYDDNFYDADPTSWMNRFAGRSEALIEMRPVHPFSFLIFRPLTWLVALLLNGNRFYAALLLNSAAGALCVLLAWLLVRRWSNGTYAALSAAWLGATASHLVFSTFLESYIFSAAALTGFVLIVDSPERPLRKLIPAGLLIFGITISNFIQVCILYVFSEFKPGKLAKFILAVLALGLVLAWLQAALYPTSQPFYDPAHMLSENRYSSSINKPERAAERAYIVARTILLYSTVGPRPLALLEEVGCLFPCFKTYRPQYGRDIITSYAGFGSWLARLWFAMLLAAGSLFAWRLVKIPRQVLLQAGLAVCLLFNFVLHLFYGDDPMLYTPDSTYALIFFAALSFKDWAGRLWFQMAGLGFLIALMVNNWVFLHSMLVAVEPFR